MPYATCPVCGWEHTDDPLEQGDLCGCCGVEIGVDDEEKTHAELTREWVTHGCRWFNPSTGSKPFGWDPLEQLVKAGLVTDDA